MKKLNILITTSLLSALYQVHAQSPIIFDFQSRSKYSITNVDYNQHAIYQIQNINRLLYKVTINGEVVNYNSIPNDIFKILQQDPLVINKLTPATLEELETIQKNDKIRELDAEEARMRDQVMEKQATLTDVKNKIQQKLKSSTDINIKEEELRISNLEEEIKGLNNYIADIRSQNIKDDPQAKLFLALANMRNTYMDYENLKNYQNSLRDILISPSTNYSNVLLRIKEVKIPLAFTYSSNQLDMGFKQMKNHFDEAVQVYLSDSATLKKFNSDTKKARENISSQIKQAQEIDSLYRLANYGGVITNIRLILLQLSDENLFQASSSPIQATGDAIKFKIEIEPKQLINNIGYTEKMTFETRVPVKGGIKIDFSTGVAFRFGTPDDIIVKRAQGTDSTQLLAGVNNNAGNLTLGAFMHVYERRAKNHHHALTFGIGLNSTDIKDATVFLGYSWVIGAEKRAILSGGLSVAQAKRLDPRFSFNQTYFGATLPEDLTTNVTRLSAFIAFSYNISQ